MDADRAGVARGRALLSAGQPAKALAEFATVLATSPDDYECLLLSASAETELAHGREAIAFAQAAVKLLPDDEQPLRILAYALMVDQRLGPARDAAQRAVELDPDSWRTHFVRAAVDVQGKLLSPQALYSAEVAVSLAPNEPATHVLWGRVLRMDGEKAAAEEQFREALRLDPTDRDALFDLGIEKLRRGDAAGASSVFIDFAAADPNAKGAVFNLRISAGRILRLPTWLLMILSGIGWLIAASPTWARIADAQERTRIPLIVLTALVLLIIVLSIVSLRRVVGRRFGKFVTGVVKVDRLLALWGILLLVVLALCVAGVLVPAEIAAWLYFGALLVTLGAKYTESERRRAMHKERMRMGR